MAVKGLRQISTLHRQGDTLIPRQRAGALAELTHLEHEKVGLERKLSILSTSIATTQESLGRVEARIALLEHGLYEARTAPASSRAARSDFDSGAQEPPAHREVALEY